MNPNEPTREALLAAVTDLDEIGRPALQQIAALSRLTLAALETPGPRTPADIAAVLQAVALLADCAADDMAAAAERAGAA